MKKWLDKVPADYRKPLICAVIFHIALFVALGITFVSHPKIFQVSAPPSVPVIHAQVISSKAYEKQQQEKRAQRRAIEKRKLAKEKAKREKAIALKRKEERIKRQKAEKLAKAKALKRKREKAKKLAKAKAVKAKQAKAKKLKAERKKALAAFKAQTKAANARAAAAAKQRALTIQQKYMGLIQAVVRANWINQFDPLQTYQVTLKIFLDQKGDVDNVQVVKSSGNTAFDRQAVLAVEKSSPLPLPKEKAIAKDFRVLTLPFSNQQVS